jgi:glycosyltransferase involved in cell wall biosynthesis
MIVDNGYPDPRVEREALALVARGHHVDVICARTVAAPRHEVVDGVRVHRLPVVRQRGSGLVSQLLEYTAFLAWSAAELLRLQMRARFDVVQVHNVPDFLVFAALPAKLVGTPVILDLHDLMPEFYASRFGGRMDSVPVRLVRWQERVSAALADAVVTVTSLWRDTLVRRGLDPAKVRVVMNAPDERLYPRQPPKDTEGDPIRLIYHGTLTHRYGIDLMLQAVAEASRRIPLRVTLHGRGEMAAEVERLVDELGLSNVVDLSTAKLPATELARLIRSADIGIVPNRNDVFTDGILPTKLMEYVVLGIPAIVTRSAATTAYFDDSMVAFVPPGDAAALAEAIVQLAGDPLRRRALAGTAQRFLDRHPWSAEAATYTELVETLAGLSADDDECGRRRPPGREDIR